jgi:RHS repeat-associated protein
MTQETVSIQTASQGQLNFQYDTQSNRVRKVTDSGSLIYVRGVNGWPLVEWSTTDTGQAVATEYLYGTKGIFAIRQGGKILPVLTDHLNSVRALVGPDGRVQAAFHYSPFGKVVAEFGGADELRYRFTGYEYDKETGLYNASARLYDPSLKRFYSVDPQMQFYSPYLYCGNNPISVVDPTGEAAWWAILVGAVVGIIATVATGGALAPAVAGLEGAALTAATVGVAATAGAVGSIAGDATTAGLSGEKFTATRALVDIAGGAAGGGVGAFVGAPAASLAMRGALSLSEEISARAVSTIGTITAGVVGGTAGAVAQSAVTSAMTGQSFFSVSTAVNIIIGGAAGFGGSLLGSGAHMGWGGDTMPVPLGRQDFDLIRRNVFAGDAGYGSLISFNRNRAEYAFNESMYQLNPANAVKHDVINMHGSRGMVYVTIATRGGLMYERPLSPKLLGEFLNTRMQDRLGNNPTIKLAICYGGKGGWFSKSAGQTLATALGRDVYGAKGTTYSPSGSPDHEWIRFQP